MCQYCEGVGKIEIVEDGKIETEVCEECKGQGGMYFPRDANRFLETWTDIIEKKARLYGLDRMKADNLIQFNQYNTGKYVPDMKFDKKTKRLSDKLSIMIKEQHEANAGNEDEV
jgi:hypothetical protein